MGGAGLSGEARVCAESLRAGGMADQDRRRERPAPGFCQQLWAVRLDELEQLSLELVRLAGEATDLRELLAGDADANAGGHSAQLAVDTIELARL